MFAIGKILKPHGIRGEIKALCYLDSPEMLSSIKNMIINDKNYMVEKLTPYTDYFILKLKTIEDRNAAESLRDSEIFCDDKDKPNLDNGRFYVSDIIGCDIFDKEKKLGTIVDILQYGSADVVVFVDQGKKYLFPWVKSLNVNVDLKTKSFFVDYLKLQEVLSDEN